MPEEKVNGLAINITYELIEDLLKQHVKNVPEDIKIVSANSDWFNRSIRIYFNSKHFPVVAGQLKANCVNGHIEVTTGKDAKLLGIKLVWDDPDKKKKGGK